ncbi:hypothetical protein OHB13_19135 [Streptomyces sp. NBC_00440]|uniref:hypothetical protein n=1 Tax=Streptomyces sp. NBC_00440 TaxID=2975741 RepID=UPI002E22CC85
MSGPWVLDSLACRSTSARAASGPVTVLTSDVDDLVPLCGKGITVLKVWHSPGSSPHGSARS